MNTDEIILRFKKKHGNKYDYTLVNYINKRTKVKILCQTHGIFEQLPSNHNLGCGCPKCNNYKALTKEEFLEKSEIIHKKIYDYSLVEYRNSKTKIKIICAKHGVFEQAPKEHIRGAGCQKCGNVLKLNNSLFIERSNIIHNKLYDYSMVKLINNSSKVKIICVKHGIFEQTPNAHLKGQGCPTCRNSKGELEINKVLIDRNIKYIKQYTFDDLKFKKKLHFDFGILDENGNLLCLIEYNGSQHYIKYDKFHKTENDFIISQKRDILKSEYCKKRNIPLYIIDYNEDIKEKLNLILNVD